MTEPYGSPTPEPDRINDAMPEAPWSSPAAGQPGVGGGVPGWGTPSWGTPQDQPPGAWPTPPNTWNYTPYPQQPQQSAARSRAIRGGIGVAVAVALVAVAFIVFESGSNSSNTNDTAPASIPSGIASSLSEGSLDVCLSAGQPLLTMLSALATSSTDGTLSGDSTAWAAAIQTAINQEQQLADTLPDGSSKSEIAKTISELKTMQSDVAAQNYTAEGTDIQTLSTDTDGIMASCNE